MNENGGSPTEFLPPSVHEEYSSRLKSPSSTSPSNSKQRPSRKPTGVVSDRFIPSRCTSDTNTLFELPPNPMAMYKEDNSVMYNNLLRNEILDSPYRNIFSFKSSPKKMPPPSAYPPSPLGESSKQLLSITKRYERKIAKQPFKIIPIPRIYDDFYLNLIDWSPQNILAVGSANHVYVWNASISQISKLCTLTEPITSVCWLQRGNLLSIGTHRGVVHIYDIIKQDFVREFTGHRSRVGSLAWNGSVLSSGSRDRWILHHDLSSPSPYVDKFTGHLQEVCGLKWSFDGQHLASGGNDNKLFVWEPRTTSCVPLYRFTNHTAAVKAIAWSPHQRGLLASGGGTADRCIRFWNVSTGEMIDYLDTGSQVCDLAWSKNVDEIVSTHGYSQNQVVVWSYPTMTQLATLTGHSMRVLYLSVSPDGQSVVTGAGDNTLRFWNIFPGAKDDSVSPISRMLSYRDEIR